MKIEAIRVYQVDLPLIEGRYTWAGGKHFVETFDSTIVEILTDEGIAGYGENTPLGSAYLPAFALGARAAIRELAPHLLSEDPTAVGRINAIMDTMLNGHGYAKSAIDMACWDLLGKASGQSVSRLLGGKDGEAVQLYRAISQDTPEGMAENVEAHRRDGYRRFQLKVGSDVESDIARIHAVSEVLQPGDVLVADANTGWLVHEAARIVRGVRDVDVYIEQPCATYEECLTIRRRTDHPFVLDENIEGLGSLLRAHADGAMDVVNIKISKFGGLTRARQARDLCVQLGVAMTLEDTWGGDIVTAAIAHLAHSTPEEFRFTSTDFNSYVTVDFADGAPRRSGGFMKASDAPGLGIEPRLDVLGDPVLEIG